MSRTPLPTAANDPIVRALRETCVRFTDSAQNAGLLAPLLVLIAEALTRLFGSLEALVLLWRAGALPAPAPKPIRAPRSHARRTRGKRRPYTRRRAPVPRLRPTTAPAPVAIKPRPLRPSAPNRRIDRYPKPSETALLRVRKSAL